MKYLFSILILSCIAANVAQADVIVSDDAVVVKSNRDSESSNRKIISNDRNVQIYTGNDSHGQAFVMKNGRLERLSDGEYTLPSGKKVNIKNGRLDAQFGDKPLDSDIKIIPNN